MIASYRRPLIGLTCYSEVDDDGRPSGYRLGHRYVQAVLDAGGLPVLIPNAPAAAQEVVERLDGLLVSGGRDVEPSLYGEAEQHPTVELDRPRDATELPLIRWAYERGLPLLGICRGIQAVNVALGGSLFQDLPSQRPGPVVHRQSQARHVATHQLILRAGSLTARCLGTETLMVNSFHHQAVRNPAPCLRVVGHAEDGVIEALEAEDRRFFVCVQYHPEEMTDVCGHSRRLFEEFVRAAAEGAG